MEKLSSEWESELPKLLKPNQRLFPTSSAADGQNAFERVTPGPFLRLLPRKARVGKTRVELALFPPGRRL